MNTVAVPHVSANDVVVTEHVHRPANRIHAGDLLAKFGCGEFIDPGKQEIHWHLQFIAVLAVVLLQFVDIFRPSFPDQYRVILVRNLSQPLQHAMQLG